MASSTTNYNLIKPDYEDNADIKDLNDNFDTIDTAMNNKVDKEIGKGLSTNDYTTAEKTKLDNLAEIKTVGTGLNLDDNGELTATGGGSGGTTNYNDLSNKPQINGNTLSGNKTSAQLGLASASDIPTTLADLSGDSTHRTVTDIEKSTWNGKQSALSSAQLDAVNSGIDSTKVAQIATNENNISLILNGDGSIKPYTDIGRIGYSVETVVLLGATLNNFQSLQSNIAIMPAVKPTDKTYTLWICDSTNPSTLPIAANMQIKVLLYGITK